MSQFDANMYSSVMKHFFNRRIHGLVMNRRYSRHNLNESILRQSSSMLILIYPIFQLDFHISLKSDKLHFQNLNSITMEEVPPPLLS